MAEPVFFIVLIVEHARRMLFQLLASLGPRLGLSSFYNQSGDTHRTCTHCTVSYHFWNTPKNTFINMNINMKQIALLWFDTDDLSKEHLYIASHTPTRPQLTHNHHDEYIRITRSASPRHVGH